MKVSLNALTATEIADGIVSGKFSAEAVTRACIDRIDEREETVGAWAFFDPTSRLNKLVM